MVKSWGYVAFRGKLVGGTPAHTYSHAPVLQYVAIRNPNCSPVSALLIRLLNSVCSEVYICFMLNGVIYHLLLLARNSGSLFDTVMQKLSGPHKMST